MKNKLDTLIREGYAFQMGEYISRGWKLFSMEAGSFIAFLILFIAITTLVGMVPGVAFANSLVQQLLIAGVYIYCFQMLKSEARFSHFFEGFQHFKDIILYLLVLFLLFLPLIILTFIFLFPWDLVAAVFSQEMTSMEAAAEEWLRSVEGNLPGLAALFAAILLITIYIRLSYVLVLPLIVVGKLGFWDAMETSRKLVGQHFFSFLLLYIVLGIMLAIGTVVTLGFGLLVLIPFLLTTQFAMYEKIVGLGDEEVSPYDSLIIDE